MISYYNKISLFIKSMTHGYSDLIQCSVGCSDKVNSGRSLSLLNRIYCALLSPVSLEPGRVYWVRCWNKRKPHLYLCYKSHVPFVLQFNNKFTMDDHLFLEYFTICSFLFYLKSFFIRRVLMQKILGVSVLRVHNFGH